jgi:hypothetical protein
MGFEMSLSPVVNLFVMFGGRLIRLSVIIHMGVKLSEIDAINIITTLGIIK